jgi:Mor family transcriptional regulator
MSRPCSKLIKEALDNLTVKELPPPYDEFATMFGMETAIRMAERVGGSNVYFPKIEKLTKVIRDELLVKEFNGSNFRELAQKYGLTEVWVRKIISKQKT